MGIQKCVNATFHRVLAKCELSVEPDHQCKSVQEQYIRPRFATKTTASLRSPDYIYTLHREHKFSTGNLCEYFMRIALPGSAPPFVSSFYCQFLKLHRFPFCCTYLFGFFSNSKIISNHIIPYSVSSVHMGRRRGPYTTSQLDYSY